MKKRFGIDQTTAWLIAVLASCLMFGTFFWIVTKIAKDHEAAERRSAAEQSHGEGDGHGAKKTAAHGESHGEPEAKPGDGHNTSDAHGKPDAHDTGDAHDKPETHNKGDTHEGTEGHEKPPAKHDTHKNDHEDKAPEQGGHGGGAEGHGKEHSSIKPIGSDGSGNAWSYEKSSGPDHWGDLDSKFTACKAGRKQSPIDLNKAVRSRELRPIHFDYKTASVNLTNNGHTLVAEYESGSTANFDLETFYLKQLHFHLPSEHTVAGVPYDLELHFVHQSREGHTLIVGVLFEEGAHSNVALKKIWQDLPEHAGDSNRKVRFNAEELLPDKRTYYFYNGSLTAPPCSEGVKWVVMTQPVQISSAQVDPFISIFRKNARPTQPLFGRDILLSYER